MGAENKVLGLQRREGDAKVKILEDKWEFGRDSQDGKERFHAKRITPGNT